MQRIDDFELKANSKLTDRYASVYVPAMRIAVLYGLFAALWIIFSDSLIDLMATNKAMLSVIQTTKGLVFVIITTVILYVLIRRSLASQQQLVEVAQKNRCSLNLLLNTIPYGIQENDLNGQITFSNQAQHDMLGFPSDALIGHYIWDFQIDEVHKQHLKEYLRYLVNEQPEPEPMVSTNMTKQGQEVVFETVWDYLKDDKGKVTGFISVLSDITHK